ncbi:MAG TPA: DUF1272 domain-containing protein [Chitinophagaceae bacterium]|nr:DUF1272 domain-containing protein [Chitinophagaceae bacterium]
MLIIKPECERCGRPLPNHSTEAMICTFECTFCSECVTVHLNHTCPNCGGNFERRPIRPEHLLATYPPASSSGAE